MPDRFSMAREARNVLGVYYADFMENEWDPKVESSRFIPDLVGRYVWFESYMRNKISESNPQLNDLMSLGRLDSLVRRILPEFPQFIGIMAIYHGWDTNASQAPLDKPPYVGTSPGRTKGLSREEGGSRSRGPLLSVEEASR